MMMRSLIQRIRSLLRLPSASPMDLSASETATLTAQIASTQQVEFDCEETYRLLDQFAEAVWRGEQTEPWIPMIRAHLERCQDCQAEFEALLEILETSGR